MTGPRGGVIGVRKEQSIRGFVTHMHERYETADEDPWMNAVLVSCSQPRRADAIEQLLLPAA
jgi:calcineurin-like phosphoesterase